MLDALRRDMARGVLPLLHSGSARVAGLVLASASLSACFYTPPFRGVEAEQDAPPFTLETEITAVVDLSSSAPAIFGVNAVYDRNSVETITYAFVPEGQDLDSFLTDVYGVGTLTPADVQTVPDVTQYNGPRSNPLDYCAFESILGRPRYVDLLLIDPLPDDQRTLADAYTVRTRIAIEFVGGCLSAGDP